MNYGNKATILSKIVKKVRDINIINLTNGLDGVIHLDYLFRNLIPLRLAYQKGLL